MKTKILLSTLLFLLVLSTRTILAWDDCPKALVNDPYPGECGHYVDTNNNKICDHSEPDPNQNVGVSDIGGSNVIDEDIKDRITGQELKTKTVSEVAQIFEIDEEEFITQLELQGGIKKINPNDSFQFLHDNFGLAPSFVKDIAANLYYQSKGQVAAEAVETNSVNKDFNRNYFLPIITLIIALAYTATTYLTKIKKLSLVKHRQIWNIILTISFLSTGLLGLLLVLRISHGITFNLPFNMLFWHVEAGIVFTLIGLFHFLWHLPYYKNLLKKK